MRDRRPARSCGKTFRAGLEGYFLASIKQSGQALEARLATDRVFDADPVALIEHSLPASRRFTVIHAGRRLMLDHMLVSRPLMAYFRELEVHNEMLGDELVAQTLAHPSPESYHAPIVAEFDIG